MNRVPLVALCLCLANVAVAQAPEPATAQPSSTIPEASAPAAIPEGSSAALRAAVLGRRIHFGAGALSTAYGFRDGLWGDTFATLNVDGRWLVGGFTVEAGVLHALPVVSASAAQSFTGHLRAGWTFSRASIAAGVSAQLAPAAQPSLQLLPSLTFAYAFERFGVSGGIFDVHGLALARLSFEQEQWGVGYVAPLGFEAHARFRLGNLVTLTAQAMAFRVLNAQVIYVSLGGAVDGEQLVGGAP